MTFSLVIPTRKKVSGRFVEAEINVPKIKIYRHNWANCG